MTMKQPTIKTICTLAASFIVSAFTLQSNIAAVNGFTVVSHHANRHTVSTSTLTHQPTATRQQHSRLCLLDPSSIGFSADVLQLPSIGELYESCLDTYPLPTKSFTAGLLCGVGDYVAQKRDTSIEKIDGGRLRRFALKGLGGGLIWSVWYDNIDFLSESWLLSIMPSSAGTEEVNGIAKVVTSMVLEQFLWCPLVFGLWEIPIAALLNGARPETIPGTVQSKLGSLLVENAKVWTPANLLVYNVPAELRILMSSVIDILWQSILSDVAAECGPEVGASQPSSKDTKKQRQQAQPQIVVSDPGVAMVSNFLKTGDASSQGDFSSSKQQRMRTTTTPAGTQAVLEMNR